MRAGREDGKGVQPKLTTNRHGLKSIHSRFQTLKNSIRPRFVFRSSGSKLSLNFCDLCAALASESCSFARILLTTNRPDSNHEWTRMDANVASLFASISVDSRFLFPPFWLGLRSAAIFAVLIFEIVQFRGIL